MLSSIKQNLYNLWCQHKVFMVIIAVLLILTIVFISLYAEKEGFAHDDSKMVLYHLKGCHHCEKLMPVWNKLKETHGAHMVDYEATAHPELMKSHGISSFPTIMKGKHKYEGPRTYEGLLGFLMTQKGGGLMPGEVFGIIIGISAVILLIILGVQKHKAKKKNSTQRRGPRSSAPAYS